MGYRASLPLQAHLRSSELSIGVLAQQAGVRPSAIRYYEACGLLPAPERRAGRRRYERAAVERLRMIVAARRLGFSIAELGKLAATNLSGLRNAAKLKARSLTERSTKLRANAAQLEELSKCDCASGSACRL